MSKELQAARLGFALCLVTTAVNLQAPLYTAYARQGGYGIAITTLAFSAYVVGILPVLLALGGLSDRIGRRPLIQTALGLSIVATGVMLLWPRLEALVLARWLLGTAVALTSATAPAYMAELLADHDARKSANWVTASTSLGFGLGAALTSLCLLWRESLRPASFWLHLAFALFSLALLRGLPERISSHRASPMLRLPYYPRGSLPYGLAILLAWATVGLVIAVLPSVLATHGLERWSGFSTFTVTSCGLFFQPLARRFEPYFSTRLGLAVLPPAYALLAWGALTGSLTAVLVGALASSSACYGFVYLGGLSGVAGLAGEHKTRTSAGFFLLAYVGFSLPVITTGVLADRYGLRLALVVFGGLLAVGAAAVAMPLRKRAPSDPASTAPRPEGVAADSP